MDEVLPCLVLASIIKLNCVPKENEIDSERLLDSMKATTTVFAHLRCVGCVVFSELIKVFTTTTIILPPNKHIPKQHPNFCLSVALVDPIRLSVLASKRI